MTMMFKMDRTDTAFDIAEIQVKSEMIAKGQSMASCPTLRFILRSFNNADERSKLNGKIVFVQKVISLSPRLL